MLYHAPPYYGAVLAGLALAALGATVVKLVINPVQGLLFEGATFGAFQRFRSLCETIH